MRHVIYAITAPDGRAYIGATFGMNEIRFTHNGQTKNLMQWCRQTGVRYETALARKAAGWPIEQAVGLVPRQKQKRGPSANRRFIEVGGVRRSINEWAAHLGVRPGIIHTRLYLGWSEEKAVTVPKR